MEKSDKTLCLFYDTRDNEMEIQYKISKMILNELNTIHKDIDRIETLSYIYKNIKGWEYAKWFIFNA